MARRREWRERQGRQDCLRDHEVANQAADRSQALCRAAHRLFTKEFSRRTREVPRAVRDSRYSESLGMVSSHKGEIP